MKITVKGKEKNEKVQYDFSIFSKGKGMGEGTGIPAAIGAILMSEGFIIDYGVFPPEGVLDPIDIFKILFKILIGEKIKDNKKEVIDLTTLISKFI